MHIETIAVLNESTEGLSTRGYADALREKLPDVDVTWCNTRTVEREATRTADVITGISVERDIIENAKQIELFAATSSGVDHLPLPLFRRREIFLTNASGIHAPGIAEQVLGYILLFARNIHRGIYQKMDSEWRHYQASELKGSTVTILGLGAIGTAVATRLESFDVQTIGIRYTPSKGGPTDQVCGLDSESLDSALWETDYLVVCSPLTEETDDLIDEHRLETLPPNAVIINVGRGPIVNTEALVNALKTNSIRGAALDVTDPEPLPNQHDLWDLKNVIITPHMGGHTPKHWDRMADIVKRNVIELNKGDESPELENRVDI